MNVYGYCIITASEPYALRTSEIFFSILLPYSTIRACTSPVFYSLGMHPIRYYRFMREFWITHIILSSNGSLHTQSLSVSHICTRDFSLFWYLPLLLAMVRRLLRTQCLWPVCYNNTNDDDDDDRRQRQQKQRPSMLFYETNPIKSFICSATDFVCELKMFGLKKSKIVINLKITNRPRPRPVCYIVLCCLFSFHLLHNHFDIFVFCDQNQRKWALTRAHTSWTRVIIPQSILVIIVIRPTQNQFHGRAWWFFWMHFSLAFIWSYSSSLPSRFIATPIKGEKERK